MNPVPPHHLLSAYLDGELSADEREQVERLLEESPEARQELRELEQVGEWLRQLPREALPQPIVLDVANTSPSEPASSAARSKPRTNGAGKKTAASRQRGRGWPRIASVIISAAALSLIVLLSWPQSPDENHSEIARHTSSHEAAEKIAFSETSQGDRGESPRIADDAGPATVSEAQLHWEEQRGTAKDRDSGDGQPSPGIASADALTDLAPGEAEGTAPLVFNKDLKAVPIGQMVEALDQQGEQVAVVKLVVVDRQQGLRDLQILLQRHQIAITNPADRERDPSTDREAGAARDSALLAVYVETSDDRFAAAMRDLQREAAFQQLQMEAPIAVAGLDPLMESSKPGLDNQPRNRMRQFSGRALPQTIRIAPASEPSSPASPSAQEKAPAESAPDQADSKPMPSETQSPSSEAPAPRIGVARARSLNNLEDQVRQPVPSDEAKRQMREQETGGPGTQRKLTLSPHQLESLQKQISQSESKKTETEKAEEPRRGVEPIPSGKQVQVLFVLVDQAPPADDTPSAADDNGAA